MKSLALTVACMMISTAALAQTTTPSPSSQPYDPYPVLLSREIVRQADRLNSNQQSLRYVIDEQAARNERAERLARLANAGRCGEAIDTARAEGDGAMARSLERACAK